MSGVQTITVAPEDAGMRLDKWFKAHYPGLSFGRLQKLLRTAQVRLDGRRVKDARIVLKPGQSLRVPPLDKERTVSRSPAPARERVGAADAAMIQACVLHRDDHILILNKPPGLAVQGGSGTSRHVDGLLEALQFTMGERPRLVHRLDKDTSGILLLARTRSAAQALTAAFRAKAVRKAYWAAVVGVPEPSQGRIDLPLGKRPGRGGERMQVDEVAGKQAVSVFRTIERAGRKAAWLELEPLTGRTHQLRAHMAAIGTPILGDGKYAGREAFVSGAEISHSLHLHARAIRFEHPAGGMFAISAPMADHMKATWAYLGFDETQAPEPFV